MSHRVISLGNDFLAKRKRMTGQIGPLKAWHSAVFHIAGLPLLFALLLLPDFVRGWLCPSDTFLSGPIGSDAGIVSALLVLPSFFLLGILVGVRGPLNPRFKDHDTFVSIIKNHPVPTLVIALSAIGICVFFWAKATFSYYCAAPARIRIHSSLLGPTREFTWADVKRVEGRCWAGSRTPWQGGLDLTMADGETILLPFGTGQGVHGAEKLKRTYDTIKEALRGEAYVYDASGIKLCTSSIYPLLENWPYDGL